MKTQPEETGYYFTRNQHKLALVADFIGTDLESVQKEINPMGDVDVERVSPAFRSFLEIIVGLDSHQKLRDFYEETGISVVREEFGEDYKLTTNIAGAYPDGALERWPEFEGEYLEGNADPNDIKADVIVSVENPNAEGIKFIEE